MGSLSPTFVPARRVCLAVKLPCAFTLYGWFPFSLREPLGASVTLSEATAPVKLPTRTVPTPDDGRGLEPRLSQGGISTMAPPRLASQLQSLPPILHKISPNSMPSCSKASRGLFVLLRVTRIFTRTSMFAESLVETVLLSLRHSCGSEPTRQGISLP